MHSFDRADLVGGVLLFLTGSAVSWVSIASYPLGTLNRMGPGMFPAGLGVLLALFGIILVLQSLGRERGKLDIRIFSPLFVLSSVVAFALLISTFGMIPAVLATTILASFAELEIRPVSLALLCLALCLISPVVFVFLLGLNVPLLQWPF